MLSTVGRKLAEREKGDVGQWNTGCDETGQDGGQPHGTSRRAPDHTGTAGMSGRERGSWHGGTARAGGEGKPLALALALLTDQGHHQDEFPAVQQRYQAAEVVDETIGVWDQEDRSDLQLHLPHLTLVFQHGLEEKDT